VKVLFEKVLLACIGADVVNQMEKTLVKRVHLGPSNVFTLRHVDRQTPEGIAFVSVHESGRIRNAVCYGRV